MDNEALIDTDILIDAGRGVSIALERLAALENEAALCISVITRLELIIGCRNKRELAQLEKFLKRFRVVPLDAKASEIVADLIKRYYLSYNLLLPDALIAATALALDIPLHTKNQRDYRFIASLKLPHYP